MRVLVLHAAVPPDAPPDEQDVLAEVRTVVGALREVGHEARVAPLAGLGWALPGILAAEWPDVVFNLVESLDGDPRLEPVLPSLLAHLKVPFTGCPARATFVTSDKVLAKRLMNQAGVPTPDWWLPSEGGAPGFAGPYILKPLWEDASVGIDDGSLCADEAALRARLATIPPARQRDWFVEAFLDGREFNVSVIERDGAPHVLPPAEILFNEFPPGKPRLVGYAAKWDESSFEYHNTIRSFAHPSEDAPLLARLEAACLRCWDLFGLRGYARVDFRVGEDGRPQVLEVNTNPCIADDAGFLAAAAEAGLDAATTIELIVRAARREASR